jgi:hypothetical protein
MYHYHRLCCGSGPFLDQQREPGLGHPARVFRVVLRGLLANCEELGGVDSELIGVKIGS